MKYQDMPEELRRYMFSQYESERFLLPRVLIQTTETCRVPVYGGRHLSTALANVRISPVARPYEASTETAQR